MVIAMSAFMLGSCADTGKTVNNLVEFDKEKSQCFDQLKKDYYTAQWRGETKANGSVVARAISEFGDASGGIDPCGAPRNELWRLMSLDKQKD